MSQKVCSVLLLILVQSMVLSLWFISSAILADLNREHEISGFAQAALASAVQAGFVLGALVVAITGVADRLDPRLVLGGSAIAAAVVNAGLLVAEPGGVAAIALRLVTGVLMAGVYPVGMKLAVGWGVKDRGFLVGLLVGGLTIGSASSHLVAFFGGADWRTTVSIASLLAGVGGLLMVFVRLGPHHRAAAGFNSGVLSLVWRDRKIRAAYCGYFGHMFELYAMWAWLGVALTAAFADKIDEAGQWARLVTFVAIAAGGLASAVAGWVADRIGKAELAIAAMALSGLSAIAFGCCYDGPVWSLSLVAVFWGLVIVPDSAQFSALIADFAPADQAGSVMTLQTALGFALTILTVQVTPVVASYCGWPIVMAGLAIGPAFGIVAMWGLRSKGD